MWNKALLKCERSGDALVYRHSVIRSERAAVDFDRRFSPDKKSLSPDRLQAFNKGGGARHGHNRSRFLELLIKDLSAAGFRVRKPHDRDKKWKFTPPDHRAQVTLLRRLRHQQISASRDFVERMESRGVLTQFGDGISINPVRIRPQIRFCVSQAEHDVFRYGKLFQKVPTTNRVGRQVRCLVYDVGQSVPFLMGVIELTSGAYTLGCRDDHLGWRGQSRKLVKDSGLRRVMDLASIVAVPPYNLLLGGKLIASVAFSDVVVREIRRRYRSDLLGVIATSATGLHCAILNRIGLKPGGLFRRIGETSGYSTLFASAATLNAARRFLPGFVSAPEGKFSVSVRPLHVLRVAMRACDIPPDQILQSAYPKGVYFGTVANSQLGALRNGRALRQQGLSLESIVKYWKEKYLPKVLSRPDKLEKFVSYRRHGPLEPETA
jgi:hypothetical protein